jgi:hypothetical protein
MMPDPDAARVMQIRALHYEAPWTFVGATCEEPHPCYGCGFKWPCDTAVVLGALAAAEQERDRARRVVEGWGEAFRRWKVTVRRVHAENADLQQRATRLEALEAAALEYLRTKSEDAWERLGDAVAALTPAAGDDRK